MAATNEKGSPIMNPQEWAATWKKVGEEIAEVREEYRKKQLEKEEARRRNKDV